MVLFNCLKINDFILVSDKKKPVFASLAVKKLVCYHHFLVIE